MTGMLVPISPPVLRWAIETSGLDQPTVADKVGVDQRLLSAWLRGSEQPNMARFRKLAEVLKRPSATLLRRSPPADSAPTMAFRHPPEAGTRYVNRQEVVNLRDAVRLQRGLAWITQELGDKRVDLPKVPLSSDTERGAARVRSLLRVSVEEQLAWRSDSIALRAWREALEDRGLSVFLLSMGARSSRGFSLWNDVSPLIAVNTHWNNTARIFTIGHELGHLVTRTNSICVERAGYHRHQKHDELERWCEAFSAALLMPWSAVENFLLEKTSWKVGQRIEQVRLASRIAKAFKVSHRAAIIRLIHKGLAGWELYQQIPRTSETKSGGGGGGRVRAQIRYDAYGRRTALVIARGVDQELLTRHDALSYLNVADREFDDLRAIALSP